MMNPITVEQATESYSDVIVGEINRCQFFIDGILEEIAENGETPESLILLERYQDEMEMWKNCEK